MPRYYFHIHHTSSHIDHEGEELPDKDAAWREATETAGRILQGLDGRLKPDEDPWRMIVADEFNDPLFEIHIAAKVLLKDACACG